MGQRLVRMRSSRWCRALLALAAVLMLACGLLLAGCSPVTRYRVLSFFFDDVPPPPGLEAEAAQKPQRVVGAWGVELPAGEGKLPPELAPAPPPVEAPKPVFYHQPYRQRECAQCHSAETSYQTPVAETEVCRKCHADHLNFAPDDWVHGPVALGRCTICHDPHKSENRGLLTKAQPDLCWTCHDSQRVLAQPYHQGKQQTDCSFCHDPHLAGNRLLLVDSGTYARSHPALQPAPAGHASWDKTLCSMCHQVAQSNVVVEDVDQQCLSCHDRAGLAPPGQALHSPVREGHCTVCHTPHRSSRPHLVKPQAEKICYTCHSPEEVHTPDHPEVTRADCLICHKGHWSDRPHLLKPGIPAEQ